MKNKKKLLLVSHCILNVRSKIQYAVEFETEEERSRKAFLKKVIEEDIQLIQLPCPEFLMYGGRRWGHSSEQFDNPFFQKTGEKDAGGYCASSEGVSKLCRAGGSAWSSRNQRQSELWDRIHFLCRLGRRVIFTTESGSISEKRRAERSDGNLYAGAERDAGRRRNHSSDGSADREDTGGTGR